MEINPYETSALETPDDRQASESDGISASDEQFLRYAQLLLRLLGVMFVILGFGGLIGSIAYGLHDAYVMRPIRGEVFIEISYVIGWFMASFAILVAGVYLSISGRWILEKVVLPAGIVQKRAKSD